MDFNSIINAIRQLEISEKLRPSLRWFHLRARGTGPSARVGHTCTWSHGVVYCVGGADPSGSYGDTFALDFSSTDCSWLSLEAHLSPKRYEHTAVGIGDDVLVFGGSNEGGNLNDVQVLKPGTSRWEKVCEDHSNGPSARTHHTNAVIKGNGMLVFGGGLEGSQPVPDEGVYVFSPGKGVWSSLDVGGESPSARQGHLMVTIENKVYVHGGMSGEVFYDDLYVLDLEAGLWSRILPQPDSKWPSGRAGHGGLCVGRCFLIFGGLTADGVTNISYLFDTESEVWTLIEGQGEIPSARLDFAFTAVSVPHGIEPDIEQSSTKSALLYVHGGMDTDGSIYDDSYIARIRLK